MDDSIVTKRIESIQFTLLNPEEIKANAVCEVTTIELYEKNEPKFGGLFDPRMGTINPKFLCSSCNQTTTKCQGHYGFVTLVKSVYLPHFLKNIVKVLQLTCHNCSHLLIPETDESLLKKKNVTKFNHCYSFFKERNSCNNCGTIQHKISKENTRVYITNYLGTKVALDADICREILQKISDKDLIRLGYDPKMSRPEWMMVSVIPIGPPCIRPSVFISGGMKSECDLTYNYIDIIKANNALKTELERFPIDIQKKRSSLEEQNQVHFETTGLLLFTPEELESKMKTFTLSREKIIDERYQHLQINVTTTMNNKMSNVPVSQNRCNRPFKSFTEKLSNKHGRIRGNLMGKRVDFSARSVISPDPSLSIAEIGLPLEVAMKITMKEIVTPYNIDKMREYVNNGSGVYPGAEFITKGKNKISIAICNSGRMDDIRRIENLTIKYGDTVHRHIIDGDYVLFNRQPSLNKSGGSEFVKEIC
jgi:DNA-directed RNA polymerase subunit A'